MYVRLTTKITLFKRISILAIQPPSWCSSRAVTPTITGLGLGLAMPSHYDLFPSQIFHLQKLQIKSRCDNTHMYATRVHVTYQSLCLSSIAVIIIISIHQRMDDKLHSAHVYEIELIPHQTSKSQRPHSMKSPAKALQRNGDSQSMRLKLEKYWFEHTYERTLFLD